MLSSDIREHYKIVRDFSQAGLFKTEEHDELIKNLKVGAKDGRLLVMCGVIGCGKTTLLLEIATALQKQGVTMLICFSSV